MTRPFALSLLFALAGCSAVQPAGTDAGGSSVDAATTSDAEATADAGATSDAATTVDAGATSDAATTVDAGATSDAGCGAACVGSVLSWGSDGGRACTRASSAIAACRDYTHSVVAEACDPQDRSCTDTLLGCEAEALRSALAHADVIAAIATAPVLYGTDPRAFDGSVFVVTIDGARIEVGGCADASCAEIPAGVRALRSALEALDVDALARGTCHDVFGSP